eukprot:GFUD01006763.1.p1 GENE.GFUD01006763.1~~GFUD01006763.1.p1  ORF type:complete len:731 (+),score=201.86 GFUD01006763.1:365-2557(+)
MLLACCFREPKKKKPKKSKKCKTETLSDSEDSYVLSKSLISSPLLPSTAKNSPNLPAGRQDTSFPAERHASNKIEQDKIQRKSAFSQRFSASTPLSKVPQNRISSPTFQNVSKISVEKELLQTQENSPKDVSRMFASAEDLDGSILSVSIVNKTPVSSYPSLASSTSKPQSEDSITSTSTSINYPSSSEKKSGGSDQSTTLTPKRNSTIENGNVTEGKNLSCDKSFLPKQVRNEEQVQQNEEKEKLLCKIKEEYEKEISELKIRNNIEIENEKEMFLVKLLQEKEKHRKDLEIAKNNAKNSANETISQLNKQIVLERAKMFVEHQENSKNLEEEFRMKEDRLNQSLALFEESLNLIEKREQAWQDERADVLKEVQRLKEEATRMVKILAMEYEEENLSEDKKRSLSQEAYSLQLVVEMRTGEVRNLREQLAKAKQELEQGELFREKLRKATARMEDLEEQIKIKNRMEKQLSVEKQELENNVTNATISMDRMSKNVESLQWRIRNNFDLPVNNLRPAQEYQCQQRSSLPAFSAFKHQEKSCTESTITRVQSTPETEKKIESTKKKSSFFMVSNEMIEATTTNTKVMDDVEDQSVTSDFSPCSDGFLTSFTDDERKMYEDPNFGQNEINPECNEEEDQQDVDLDSLDEGVGDISSEGENPESPSFQENNNILNNKNNRAEPEDMMSTINEEKVSDVSTTVESDQHTNLHQISIAIKSTVKERIPSRFSFGK